VSDVVGIDHVQVAAPPGCEEAARRFFGGVLGLAEVEKPPVLRTRGGVWFAVGRQQLHVGVEEAHAPAHKAHPALAVRDLAAAAARLEEHGAPVQWDGSRVYTADPWGNRIELVSARAPELLVEGNER
jgi:catechol 2,3-dioxygenase-like lactoylglutathione lyase family enzyme